MSDEREVQLTAEQMRAEVDRQNAADTAALADRLILLQFIFRALGELYPAAGGWKN